ncbi:MAG TPA: hypothetical protein VFI25_09890 [Planctomycetota bacterium]|nr:hypothetical protein [Planctomycetota bacterium]
MKPPSFARSLTYGSAIFLAWSVHRTLGPHLTGPEGAESTLSIRCLPRSTAHPDARGANVSLWQLAVDGRRLRWDEVGRDGAWQVYGDSILSLLVHVGDSNPGVLTCRGRSLVAAFLRTNASGRIRLERGGEPVAEEDLYTAEEKGGVAVVEIPLRPPRAWVLGGALVLFLAAAWRLGPSRTGSGGTRWLVFLLAILHFSVWASQRIGLGSDSLGYLQHARAQLFQGFPSYFPPGYPTFLAILDLLPVGGLGGRVTFVQHVMAIAVVLWVVRFLRSVLPENAVYAAGIVAGVATPSWAAPNLLLSEPLALFGMAGALHFSARSCASGSPARAAVAGLFAGWAGITRVVPLAASVPSALLLFFLRAPPRRGRLAAVFLAAALALPGLFVAWHGARAGQWRLAGSVGFHLLNRVVTSQRQLDEEGAATRELLSLLGGADPRGRVHWELAREVLKVRSYDETEQLFRRVAMEGIRKDPFAFVGFSARQALAQYFADPCPDLWHWGFLADVNLELETPPLLGWTRSSFEWRRAMHGASAWTYPVLAGLSIVGFVMSLRSRRLRPLLALGWIPVGYLLATAFVEFFLARYNAAVFPFVAGMAVVPLVWLADLGSRWTRSGCPRGTPAAP